MGVNEEQSSPTAATGTLIHENITKARNPSTLEAELQFALQPFFKEGIISRNYKNTKINADGTFTTHGADEWKVTENRECWILEYKTKSCNYVTPVDISPARFQNKMYCWLYSPIFSLIPFKLAGGQIIYVKRVGNRGDFEEIGQTEKVWWNTEAEAELMEQFEHILWSWSHPEKQIPPKRYKCLHCPPIYKTKCFFQTGKVYDGT